MAITAFLTDSTLCIGCKACEVACKEGNHVPDDGFVWSGLSYDNTRALGHSTWRHVKLVEHDARSGVGGNDPAIVTWAFSSDVCKHCTNAGCLEACPTVSIVRTEFGSVYVQPDACNGCGYCVVGCPFGMIDRPTDSILFGDLEEMRAKAAERIEQLHARGMTDAVFWDSSDTTVGGTNSLFIVRGDPRDYNLPLDAQVPTVYPRAAWQSAAVAAAALVAGVVTAFLSARRA